MTADITTPLNRAFREFKRYSGDGLPNEPTGAPLPIGDPASGVHNPDKPTIRGAFAEVNTQINGAIAATEEAQAGAETAETNAAASAVLSDARADDAASFAGYRNYKDVATLLANTSLVYGAGAQQVAAGDIIRTRAEGFSYAVAASGASDQDVTTAGGVKLYFRFGVIAFPTISVAEGATIPADATRVSIDGRLFTKTAITYRLGGSAIGDQFTSADGGLWVRSDLLRINDRMPIVVIATGQSNSLGVSGGLPVGDIASQGDVWSYERHPVGDQTTGWKLGFKHSPDYVTGQAGNHLSYHFCARLARETNRPVCHLAYSIGGVGVAEWIPLGGGTDLTATGTLWTNMQSAFAQSLTVALPFRSDGATLADLGLTQADYILWHQGEANNDAAGRYSADQGPNYVRDLLRAFRVIIQPSAEGSIAPSMARDDTLIVMGELLKAGVNHHRNIEMEQVANEVSNLRLARVGHLPSEDGVHFDSQHVERMADYYYDAMYREINMGFTVTIADDELFAWRPSHIAGAYSVIDTAGTSKLQFAFGYRVNAGGGQTTPFSDAPFGNLIDYLSNVDLTTLASATDGRLAVSAIKNRIQIRNRRGASLNLRITPLFKQPLPGNVVAD